MKFEDVARQLAKEGYVDLVKFATRMLDSGFRIRKKVTKASGGRSGAVFVPKEFIGQEVDFFLVPVNPDIIENRKVIQEREGLIRKLRRKNMILMEKERKLAGDIGTPAKKEIDSGDENDNLNESDDLEDTAEDEEVY